jgi:hypothetical protein
MLQKKSEILKGMRKFEKEGLDGLSQLINTLERQSKRESRFYRLRT